MSESTHGLKPMRATFLATALLLGAAALTGCDKAATPDVSQASSPPSTMRAEMPGIPASGVDMSVPSASAALAGSAGVAGSNGVSGSAAAPTADGNGPNQRSALTNAQEQQSMPLPGQANGHSNTVTEDNKAAAPAASSAPK